MTADASDATTAPRPSGAVRPREPGAANGAAHSGAGPVDLLAELHARVEQQHQLYRLTDRLSRARTWTDIYEAALDAILATLDADRASVLLFDDHGIMRFRAWRGLSDAYRAAVDGHSPWPYGTVSPEPIYYDNIVDAPLDEGLRRTVADEGVAAIAFIPLTYHGELLGKFMVYYDAPRHLSADEQQLALTVAGQLAFGIARARAEEALRESERRFKDMADTAPAMLWLTDQEHRCTFLSQGWYDYTGQADAEGLGLGWLDAVHPDDRAMASRVFLEAARQREPFEIDYRLRTADGAYHWAIDAGRPRIGASGDFLGYIGSVIDVHDRKRAEQALRESEAHLQLTTRAAQIGTWRWDMTTDTLWWSDIHKELWGYDPAPGPIPFTEWSRLLDRDDLERAEQAIERCRRAGEAYDVEYRITPRGGAAPRWIRSLGRADHDAAGRAISMQGVSFDITDRKALEQLQRDFVANVSHELRNPLSSLKGYAQLMRRRGSYDERAIGAILSQTGHLERLIEDLLEASRLEADRLDLQCRQVDLVAMTVSAVDLARATTDRHEIRLEAPDHPISGWWDPDRIGQVLQNLLSNAIKYSPNGGTIAVLVEDGGTEARVAVRDEGIGLAPDEPARLFERFYRVGIVTGAVRGLGLGLHISKELVEGHGGRIWAESPGPGHGSTFVVVLPKAGDGTRR